MLVPTVTLPKLTEAGDTINWPCAIPAPVSGIVSVEFEASELTAMAATALPAICGAKVVLKVIL